MAKLSPAREAVPVLKGLKLVNRGKVRDTYELGNELLLAVATDGISIFDFVLNTLVPGKGTVLTAMTHFWMKKLEEAKVCRTHLVAAGRDVDAYLPENLCGSPDLQSRALVVRALNMVPVEFIARGYLTGSVLNTYQETGRIFGLEMAPGLQDGDELPFPIDTPTTKAEEGHDEPIDRVEVRRRFDYETGTLLDVYKFVRTFAEERGIIFADTKLEFGLAANGDLVLGDEVATPDSSRFWNEGEWKKGRKAKSRKAPSPFDKQLVRNWGIGMGINNLTPKNPEDVKKVHDMLVPPHLCAVTTQIYRYIFWLLTGTRIETYLTSILGVDLEVPKRRVAVVLGSRSDLPQATAVLAMARQYCRNGHLSGLDVHILSCHRNPLELVEFVESGGHGVDVVIAAGGMAFALPGVLDAFLYARGKKIPVVGVAFGDPGSEDLLAAELSISKIPGSPVVMDKSGRAYSGTEGLHEAIARAAFGELPPEMPRVERQPELFVKFP